MDFDKLERFAESFEKSNTNPRLAIFLNEVLEDSQHIEMYISDLEMTIQQMSIEINKRKAIQSELDIFKTSYNNMKMINQINGAFIKRGLNPFNNGKKSKDTR